MKPLSILSSIAVLAALAAAPLAAAVAQDQPDFRSLYFKRLDQNKDGIVLLEDLQRIAAKEFRRTDENKDGAVTLDEYTYGIPSDRQDAIDFFTARFKRSDFNGDGKVDFNEDQSYCVDFIARADANKDGGVTLDEFLAVNGN